jgi:Xaa-Pro aminopeptidase
MYQDFSNPSDSDAEAGAERVKRLRELMTRAGLDAFLVPRADQHQGEYVAPASERLRWLTGFSGSAGMAVIARKSAVLLVDGRYTLQVRSQVNTDLFEIRQAPEATAAAWLTEHLPKSAVVGFDPWLHTKSWIDALSAALAKSGIKLKPTSSNLVDRVWGRDRPAQPAAPIVVHPLSYAGRSADDKIAALQKQLKDDGQDAAVITLPDSICWLLNIRGSDVAHNPVVLAFAIVPAKGKPELFVDAAKIGAKAKEHLAPLVKIAAPDQLLERVKALREAGRRIRIDPSSAAFAIARAAGSKSLATGVDPCIAPKATKCAEEIAGARAAHLRDGVAVARFLAWLDTEAAKGNVDEIGAVKALEVFRRSSNLLRDISFDTISGSGPNGAIVHYRVTEATNRKLQAGELFLLDSGAQYADGTTDITRTVAIGTPTDEMKARYTAVLKGHLAISMARFPKGTRGVDLDGLARRPLWALGLDYDHGTGHGVGSYLSVHEGPASISKRGMVALEPGMILSNEPGYYKTGAYGIRIENLVLVEPPSVPADGEREMLGFATLTLAPYDRRLIVTKELTQAERQWIDAYHGRVLDSLGPEVDRETHAWLAKATAALK